MRPIDNSRSVGALEVSQDRADGEVMTQPVNQPALHVEFPMFKKRMLCGKLVFALYWKGRIKMTIPTGSKQGCCECREPEFHGPDCSLRLHPNYSLSPVLPSERSAGDERKCLKCGHAERDPWRRGSDEYSTFCVPGCGCECTFAPREAERHGFTESLAGPDNICVKMVSNGAGYSTCGLPREAEVHDGIASLRRIAIEQGKADAQADASPTTRTNEEIARDLALSLGRGAHGPEVWKVSLRDITVAIATATDEAAIVERKRIQQAIIAQKWPLDATDNLNSTLAFIELPSCNCCAVGNRVASGFQHHHNECPVYTRTVAALEAARKE